MDNILASPATWVAVVLLFDVITGYYQAWCRYDLQSKKMKQGLQRKGAEVLLVIFVMIFNIVIEKNPTISEFPQVADLVRLMSLDGVCGYIILKEITSICENLIRANPELASLPFMQRLRIDGELESNSTIEVAEEIVERVEDEL